MYYFIFLNDQVIECFFDIKDRLIYQIHAEWI